MCIAALPAIAMVASLAGTAMSAVGQMQAGKAQSAAAKHEQLVANNNAIIANRMADDARKRGDVEEEDHRRKTAALQARQVTVMAANNLDVTSGSPLDVLGDTATLGELDALTIRANARREALGHQAQAMNFEAQGQAAGLKASAAKTAGTIGALGTIAGGIGTVAGQWYNMKSGSRTF